MQYRFSYLAILITLLTCLVINFNLKLWEKQDRVIEHDVHHYYSYLPLKFIYDDIKIEKSDYRFNDNYYLIWPVTTEDGRKTIKMTMGMAFLYSPFFFVANYVVLKTDYPQNGFSEPYKVFLLLSALFYLFIGLDFILKILRHYNFSDINTAITIILIGTGTNLLCYSSQSATMSHVYSFCLISIFTFYTIQWHKISSIKNTIILGLLLGLISLIRPSNAIILLFFFLFGVTSFKNIGTVFSKIKLIHIIIVSIAVVCVWAPQLLFWKTTTGKLLFYSYTDERFFFNKPKIWSGLFSFRKGWFIYTPIMLFAVVGITLLKNNLKELRIPIAIFLIVNVYVIFSWWCWWYGGTYGQRSFIDYYSILAIPLAAVVNYIMNKKIPTKFAFIVVSAFLIWLNIFQTFQFENHSLHYEAMTRKLYFKQFGRMEKIEEFEKLLVYPNYEEAKQGKR